MSHPHEYRPGTHYELVRRCNRRMNFLSPDFPTAIRGSVEKLYVYVTAKFAKQFDIDVIAICIMSNHIHEIIYDRNGYVAQFLKRRNEVFAGMLKMRYGIAGSIFERRAIRYNRLEGAGAIADKIAYVLANPVAAGLVGSPEEWPGLVTTVSDLRGGSRTAKRPEFYFRPNRFNPPFATLRLGAPTETVQLFGSIEKLTSFVDACLRRRLASAHRKHRGRWLGRERVLRTHPLSGPRTEDGGRSTAPRFTVGRDKSLLRRLMREMKEFRKAHRSAFERSRSKRLKERSRVVFPPGTGRMHFIYGHRRASYANA